MGIDSFKKRAKNAIKAAVLGASISATPAAADARDMWAKPPVPPADASQQIKQGLDHIKQSTDNAMSESQRHLDAIRARAKAINDEAKAYADSLTPEQLRQIAKDAGIKLDEK